MLQALMKKLLCILYFCKKNIMAGFLFDQLIFGPVRSRRFGNSLGINLLPVDKKICSFDCVYCECGWTDDAQSQNLPKTEEIVQILKKKLLSMKQNSEVPDNITYAGNGEPTLHPSFPKIIDESIRLRDQYFPKAEITVLSNSSMLHRKEVMEALMRIDNNVMKLDAGTDQMLQMINQPKRKITIEEIVEQLCRFNGDLVVQTLFLRGTYKGNKLDNTTEYEISRWLEHIKRIHPRLVMLYPIARETPAQDIEKIGKAELNAIAARLDALGIKSEVYE